MPRLLAALGLIAKEFSRGLQEATKSILQAGTPLPLLEEVNLVRAQFHLALVQAETCWSRCPERSAEHSFAAEVLRKDLLPVLKALDQLSARFAAAATKTKHAAFEPLHQAADLAKKRFVAELEHFGVVPFGLVGKSFDPQLHKVVEQLDDQSMRQDTIAAVHRRGLRYGKVVLQRARVTVARRAQPYAPVNSPPAGQ